MTAVANPPSFPLNQPTWGSNGGQPVNSMTEDVRVMFGRKGFQRSNSASSISSASSTSSTTTVATNGSGSQFNGTPASSTGEVSQWPNTAPRKRPQVKSSWHPGKPDGHGELGRMTGSRQPLIGSIGPGPPISSQSGAANQAMPQLGVPRPLNEPGTPVLYLVSLNGTFDRKTIHVPFEPDKLRIGRQTNQRTVPTPSNGYFDSKVLSRQHAEIWADRSGKIWIRDVKSSNGTFVNGSRLSPENRESEPHELQSADHLELGIDIVSEDQKTVVHHKVAAKVEHAGFLSAASNLLDMNFGDLDSTNGNAMQPTHGTMQMRSRIGGGAASMTANGRMGPGGGMMSAHSSGMSHQRGYWLTPITAEQIVKRLQTEMRGARLQHQDLDRTGRFVNAMLSKDDVKDLEKPDISEPPKQQSLINGSALPFRADPKARFSDPPAPPPQQPLPEKPDVPIQKRPINDRPKSHPNTSPIRDNNASQIQQLQEDLKTTKRELEGRDARLRELEESLQRERVARESAEELARRLEDSAATRTQATALAEEGVSTDLVPGSPTAVIHVNGTAKNATSNDPLHEAFEPPQKAIISEESSTAALALGRSLADQADSTQTAAAEYQSRIDIMASEIMSLKDQLELWRLRCEKVEAERDADRKSLSEKVAQIRREEQEREAAAAVSATRRGTSRGRSESRQQSGSRKAGSSGSGKAMPEEAAPTKGGSEADGVLVDGDDNESDKPTLSRANTITPQAPFSTTHPQDPRLAASLPYASMLGVVLLGMGLMAYINGWQPAPKR